MTRSFLLSNRRAATRRQFLRPLILLPFWKAAMWAEEVKPTEEGVFRLTDLGALRTRLTPNDQFYVREHFRVPKLDAAQWSIQVGGQVRSTFRLSMVELRLMPMRTLTVTLECAGNGVGRGGVSTATWTGVPLAALLRQAGLPPGVRQIRLVGADRGVTGTSRPVIPFARSLPLEKALHPDTLLAVQMNGRALPAEHGYPLRAIVPGWYGMDSVKWLVRIEALDRVDTSLFMQRRYVATRLQTVGSEQSPLTAMRVKSLILDPREDGRLPVAPYGIRGVAWAGENRITKVEVSTNGGADWMPATMDTTDQPYTWVQWSFVWRPISPGRYTLLARATDDAGNTQPAARDPARLDSYELDSYQAVHCTVE